MLKQVASIAIVALLTSASASTSFAQVFTGNLFDLDGVFLGGQPVEIRLRRPNGDAITGTFSDRGRQITASQLVTTSGTFNVTINGENLITLEFARGGQITRVIPELWGGPGALPRQSLSVTVPEPRPVQCYYYCARRRGLCGHRWRCR
jgi:hypothetical protein